MTEKRYFYPDLPNFQAFIFLAEPRGIERQLGQGNYHGHSIMVKLTEKYYLFDFRWPLNPGLIRWSRFTKRERDHVVIPIDYLGVEKEELRRTLVRRGMGNYV